MVFNIFVLRESWFFGETKTKDSQPIIKTTLPCCFAVDREVDCSVNFRDYLLHVNLKIGITVPGFRLF